MTDIIQIIAEAIQPFLSATVLVPFFFLLILIFSNPYKEKK